MMDRIISGKNLNMFEIYIRLTIDLPDFINKI